MCENEAVLIFAEFSPDWEETGENIYFLLYWHNLLPSLARYIYWAFQLLIRDAARDRLTNNILRFLPEVMYGSS